MRSLTTAEGCCLVRITLFSETDNYNALIYCFSYEQNLPCCRMYGEVLRAARLARGLSLVALSKATGVSRRYLALIEANDANVSSKYLLRVAAALGINELSTESCRVFFQNRDVTGEVLLAISGAIKELAAARDLLLSRPAPSQSPERRGGRRKRSDDSLARDIVASHGSELAPLAETPITGRFVTADTLPRGRAERTLWSADWSLPVERFHAVAYSYPEPENERYLRATVLDNSMAPTLRRGDTVRIDTAVRAPLPGQLVAVHGMASGSLLGIVEENEPGVLRRRKGAAVEIWRERFVVQGTVAKVA
jgi:transcriptional regulator with XRE-family HTH domain